MLKDKLSVLNRQFRELTITSVDGTNSETGYYRRPTEIEESILRKAMSEEYETIVSGLKGGSPSIYDTLLELFKSQPKRVCADAIVAAHADDLRARSITELGRPEPTSDDSEEDRKAFIDDLTPIFERRANELRDTMELEESDALAEKATQARIEAIARERAFEIYRRRLISQCLYEKNEETDAYELVFDNHEDVPKALDSDTINTITKAILDEVNRVKSLPLR